MIMGRADKHNTIKYKVIKKEIKNYADFEFKEYDKIFIDKHKIMYFYKSPTRTLSKHKVGFVLSIDDGIAKIVIDEKYYNKFNIFIGRSKSSGIIYLYSLTNTFASIDMKKLEVEYYKSLSLE